MKKIHFVLIPVIVLFSCKGKNASHSSQLIAPADTSVSAAPSIAKELNTDLYGNWVGDFEVIEADFEKLKGQTISRLNIVIKQITDSGVIAQSVVNGNSRLMRGTMTQSDGKYVFVMDEPGDNKYDGRFNFTINGDTLAGKWQPYDTMLATKTSEFHLTKKPFVYNANVMLPKEWEYVDYVNSKERKESYKDEQSGVVDTFINTVYRAASEKVYQVNSSKQALKERDVKNLRRLDLQILRNTIFARHGYTFKSRAVRQFFDQVDWYVPVSDNVEAALSAVEKENIALLDRFEKYAKDNYDTFGR
ncbi:MAG: YARHG domain-containing protein [Rhizobacter sp.]|nr:YARHG domain-containing protein [Ferruginibacter sp.]